jgi:hypothetical protein
VLIIFRYGGEQAFAADNRRKAAEDASERAQVASETEYMGRSEYRRRVALVWVRQLTIAVHRYVTRPMMPCTARIIAAS